MYFGATIEERGAPVNDMRTVRVRLWDMVVGGTLQCDSGSIDVMVSAGRVRIGLPAECVAAVQRSPEQWAEFSVNGVVIGARSRLGAVPFAVESQRANDLTAMATARLRGVIYRTVQTAPADSTSDWVDLPGTRINFTSSPTQEIDIMASGQLSSTGNTTNAECDIRLLLDDVPVVPASGPVRRVDVPMAGVVVGWNALWSWTGLPAGTHSIRSQLLKAGSNATACSTALTRIVVTVR